MSDRQLYGIVVVVGIIVILLGIFVHSFGVHGQVRNLRIVLVILGLILVADGGYGLSQRSRSGARGL